MTPHDSRNIRCCRERATPRRKRGRLNLGLADEIEERAAVAQHEAGVPPDHGPGLLLQVNAPADVDEEYLQSVTDVIGKALDQCCKNISSHKQATGVRLCQAGVGG